MNINKNTISNINLYDFIGNDYNMATLITNNIDNYPYYVSIFDLFQISKITIKSFNLILKALGEHKKYTDKNNMLTLNIFYNNKIKLIAKTDVLYSLFDDFGTEDGYVDLDNLSRKDKEKYVYYHDIYVLFNNEKGMIKFINDIQDKLYAFEKEDNDEYINFNKYFFNKNELLNNNKEIYKKNLEKIKYELYPNINVDLLMEYFKESDENLLLLNGLPGIGKTSFVKGFFNTLEHRSEVVYTNDISILESDLFWNSIVEREIDVLIIDDIDDVIKTREKEGGNTVVNKLLTLLDGIIRNKIKVIITTNLGSEQIDIAILRSGRCFESIELHPLSISEALNIWKKWKYNKTILDNFIKNNNQKYILQSDLIQLKKDIDKSIIKDNIFITI